MDIYKATRMTCIRRHFIDMCMDTCVYLFALQCMGIGMDMCMGIDRHGRVHGQVNVCMNMRMGVCKDMGQEQGARPCIYTSP